MKEEEKNVFQRTPFGHFLSFPHVTTDNEILGWFIEHFDATEVGLRIATGVVPFTVEDVALLLGLRAHGQRVDMEAMYVEKRDGVNLDNTQLLGHLTATSKMGEEEEHVRLLISMIFNHFLFFDGSLRSKAWYTKHLKNLNRLKRYAWANAVHTFLVEGLEEAQRDLSRRRLSANFSMKQGYVYGCVAVLQVSILVRNECCVSPE